MRGEVCGEGGLGDEGGGPGECYGGMGGEWVAGNWLVGERVGREGV